MKLTIAFVALCVTFVVGQVAAVPMVEDDVRFPTSAEMEAFKANGSKVISNFGSEITSEATDDVTEEAKQPSQVATEVAFAKRAYIDRYCSSSNYHCIYLDGNDANAYATNSIASDDRGTYAYNAGASGSIYLYNRQAVDFNFDYSDSDAYLNNIAYNYNGDLECGFSSGRTYMSNRNRVNYIQSRSQGDDLHCSFNA